MNSVEELEGFSPRELHALRGAAVWYAKYQASGIRAEAADGSAQAAAEREEYLDLLSALRKLGVRLRVPDAIAEAGARAA